MNTRFDPCWEAPLLQQQQALVLAQPSLAALFVPIQDRNTRVTLPFLPLRAFRFATLFSPQKIPARIFRSSGSTQALRAAHALTSAGL